MTPPSTGPRPRPARLCALILVLASGLYLFRLGDAPLYLGNDEARFAVQAEALATTGHDINGRWLPVFFNTTNPLSHELGSISWYQPILFYMIAGLLKVAPLSEWTVRLPIAVIALLNVGLVYAIAWRWFARPRYAALAAGLLAVSPAHVIIGRQALDSFCPLPFVLAWLWCLVSFLQTGKRWLASAAGLILGLGLYTHISSWVMMPFFVVVTLIVLAQSGNLSRATAIRVCTAFALPLMLGVLWLTAHPTTLWNVLQDYKVIGAEPSRSLTERAVFLRRFKLGPRVSVYWDYFSPSYLFFAGGSNPTQSTGQVGVFPFALILFLPVGAYAVWKARDAPARLVLLAGLLFAPVPIAAILPQDPEYAITRELIVIPFGALIATFGVELLLREPRRGLRAMAVILLLTIPVQTAAFVRDYFTDYRRRSAYRNDPINFSGVADYMATYAPGHAPLMYLSDELEEDKAVQWTFHLQKRNRRDVLAGTRYFATKHFDPATVPNGSLLLISATSLELPALLESCGCKIDQTIGGAEGADGAPSSLLLRRN